MNRLRQFLLPLVGCTLLAFPVTGVSQTRPVHRTVARTLRHPNAMPSPPRVEPQHASSISWNSSPTNSSPVMPIIGRQGTVCVSGISRQLPPSRGWSSAARTFRRAIVRKFAPSGSPSRRRTPSESTGRPSSTKMVTGPTSRSSSPSRILRRLTCMSILLNSMKS